MEQIEHHYVDVGGLKLHTAQIGTGSSVVVFLHGFPEIWYTWRHQMIAVSKAGFRAIAPDFRGYGLSDQPPEPEKASFADLVSDLLAIIDILGINKVFIVAKDFGAWPAYQFAILHPERLFGVITLGVPHLVPGILNLGSLPEGFYISRWREPGRAEADFGRLDAKTVVRNVYILFSKSEIPIASENQEIMDLVAPSASLPSWFTDEDVEAYGALYQKSGFRTALQIPYRTLLEEPKNITDPVVRVPALLIIGEKDYVFKFPGLEEYVRSGKVKEFVTDQEIQYVAEGSHFVHEQFPEQVNQLILTFLKNHV